MIEARLSDQCVGELRPIVSPLQGCSQATSSLPIALPRVQKRDSSQCKCGLRIKLGITQQFRKHDGRHCNILPLQLLFQKVDVAAWFARKIGYPAIRIDAHHN
jgi:hypothetical protein